jgi:hypothetical protein
MKYSNQALSMIFTPNKGKLLNTKGNTAQCIAHAIEVVIPIASQFILKFMKCAKIIIAILLQKYFFT